LHHGESIDFTHDAAGQLTAADYTTQADESYTYDANGNRIGTGLVVGSNNQVLSDGIYYYDYDDEGNLIRKTDIASGDYTEYAYDHRNRMTLATSYSSGAVVLQEVEFTYDVFNRRIAKTVDADGAGPGLPATRYTVYDGEHAWADFDESETVIARYLFGDQIDEILARWRPTEGTAWYLTDHLGTVRDIVDDTGAHVNTITYDSFGNIVGQTNAAAGDRFTYTGREYDAELDLYYYRARYYDPQLGRFVSQDPLSFAAGDANLYRYVGNSPTIYTDPSGLMPGPNGPNGGPPSGPDGGPPGGPNGGPASGPDGGPIFPPTTPNGDPGRPLTDADWAALDAMADAERLAEIGQDFMETFDAVGDAIGEMLGTAIDVGLLAGSVAFEPIDWLVTAWDVYQDPYNPWNYVAAAGAALPIISGATVKALFGDSNLVGAFFDFIADESGAVPLGSVPVNGGPLGFSTPAFGIEIHQNFPNALVEQTGTVPTDWIFQTAPGAKGVDASYIGPDVRYPGFEHAELKPYSQSGYNTFQYQLNNWNLPAGKTQLWWYNPSGTIGSSGLNF
jgi:RHS repeat-associated protein